MESLPTSMLSQLAALSTALLTIAKEHRDAPLATLEREVLEAVRAALPRLLEEVLEYSTSGLQPSFAHWQQTCPHCGERAEAQSWRQRSVRTICGQITFECPWFVCDHCAQGFSTVDNTPLFLGKRLGS